ncbi:MAG: CoA-binding protein [Dehalococcoidia bacterium]|nr:CoA-binding protein [Dehalococcoidia bacterium]
MPDLDFIFNPKSVAIVGVSSVADSLTNRNFLKPLLECGYRGKIYPVNPHMTELMGLKVYPSVLEIPEPVDSVVSGLPASLVPKLMRECVEARVKVVTCFSAGFSETGDAEGARLEAEVLDIARRGGVRLLGPNCLGIHNPAAGCTFEAGGSRRSGHVGFLSQSGGNTRELILAGAQRGVLFSKAVSYGNAADLDETDFLQYFASDGDTKVVAAYIEGVKRPQSFVRALRETVREKPVVILKGGRTQAGTRAVMSHTSSLAGSAMVWDAVCRQTGARQVSDMGELADAVLAFSYLRPPRGRRVGVVGIGGGASVQAADDCERAGLFVPPFPPELRRELRAFTTSAGTGIANPIDTSPDVYWEPALYRETVKLVSDCEDIDLVLVMFAAVQAVKRGVEELKRQIEAVLDAGMAMSKPLAIVIFTAGMVEAEKVAAEVGAQCLEAGVPVFPTMGRAARAVNHLISHWESQGRWRCGPR